MHFAKEKIAKMAVVITVVFLGSSMAMADLKVGQKAILYDSVNEELKPVSMKDLIDGKPLVLVVSSCS